MREKGGKMKQSNRGVLQRIEHVQGIRGETIESDVSHGSVGLVGGGGGTWDAGARWGGGAHG